jgi:hypothetical protein
MTHIEIQRAVGPLRLVFWGALLCVLDFTINGFDLLNDTIGTVLVAAGVCGLAGLPVHAATYRSRLQFIQIISVLAIAHSIYAQLPIHSPPPVAFFLTVFELLKLVAVILFCMAMKQACEEADLIESTLSWVLTRNLFFWSYAVPFGMFYLAACITMLTGGSFHFDLGPAGLLLIPLFLAPLIHFFMSTSRMKREAETSSLGASLPT